MEPGPNPEVELIGRVDDRLRAPDTSDGTIEAGEYTVTGGLHHRSAVTIDLGRGPTRSCASSSSRQRRSPSSAARAVGSTMSVRQHRREYVIHGDPWWRSHPGDELLDDVERLGLLVINEAEVPVAGQFDRRAPGIPSASATAVLVEPKDRRCDG